MPVMIQSPNAVGNPGSDPDDSSSSSSSSKSRRPRRNKTSRALVKPLKVTMMKIVWDTITIQLLMLKI